MKGKLGKIDSNCFYPMSGGNYCREFVATCFVCSYIYQCISFFIRDNSGFRPRCYSVPKETRIALASAFRTAVLVL